MGVQTLQTEKLIPIKLPEICVPRSELLKRFDRAADKRFIYVNAPGGFGKTVSALLWIQKTGLIPVWLGLDKYDNTPSTFFRLLCTALFSVIPQKREPDENRYGAFLQRLAGGVYHRYLIPVCV